MLPHSPDLQTIQPDLLCVMMTAYATTDAAISALHQGAYDFLRKPFHPDELFATLMRAFGHRRSLRFIRICSVNRRRLAGDSFRLLGADSHKQAHDLIALFLQHARRNAGVHASAHGHQDLRLLRCDRIG